ncbi:MAG TPA: hypothetical protein VG734_17850 [Lacunisphaera sp.]|nr:hypothetical protein [Lacunisphaera sp.]
MNAPVISDRVARPVNPVIVILVLAATVTPFLPFALDTSPIDVIRDFHGWRKADSLDWALLGAGLGFLTTLPMAAALLWWRIKGGFASWMRIGAVAVAIHGAGATLLFATLLATNQLRGDWAQLAYLAPAPVLFVAGAWLIRRTPGADRASLVALEAAYLMHAVTLLAVFSRGPEAGWWVTLLSVAGVVGELATDTPRPGDARDAPRPANS